jgi:hypothetical protein
MKKYAKMAITGCPQIAKVVFIMGFHPEGIFVLSRAGRVIPSICRYPDQSDPVLAWEEDLCL